MFSHLFLRSCGWFPLEAILPLIVSGAFPLIVCVVHIKTLPRMVCLFPLPPSIPTKLQEAPPPAHVAEIVSQPCALQAVSAKNGKGKMSSLEWNPKLGRRMTAL